MYDDAGTEKLAVDSGHFLQQTHGIYPVRGDFSVNVIATTKNGVGEPLPIIAKSLLVTCLDGTEGCFKDSKGNHLMTKCFSGRTATISYSVDGKDQSSDLNVKGYSDSDCKIYMSGATGEISFQGYETLEEADDRVKLELEYQKELEDFRKFEEELEKENNLNSGSSVDQKEISSTKEKDDDSSSAIISTLSDNKSYSLLGLAALLGLGLLLLMKRRKSKNNSANKFTQSKKNINSLGNKILKQEEKMLGGLNNE